MKERVYRWIARCGKCGEAYTAYGPMPEALRDEAGEVVFLPTAHIVSLCPVCGGLLNFYIPERRSKGRAGRRRVVRRRL